jgi:glycosyltransferase involved in cell wall biosynthesis
MNFCSDQKITEAGKHHGRILFLSMGLPPLISGQTTVVINLAKEFSCDEMVIAGEQSHGGAQFDWRDDWPAICYLTQAWPVTRRGGRWWRRLSFPLLLVRCIRLARRHQCSAILVVFPKEEFLLAGYLTARWTGAELYPYFHNTYLENSQGLQWYFARWLQARVFAAAKHVFVMSEGMAELYRERYPNVKASPLVHSFNEAIPAMVPHVDISESPEFIISGSISEACLDATRRVCDAVAGIKDASLTFLSGTPRRVLEQTGLLRGSARHETVPHGEVVARLRKADILVLPHGFTGKLSAEEYRSIFPTRTIEYLICGRPILAHCPADCYLTRFLKNHRCALVVDEPGVPALLKAIKRLRTDATLRLELVRNALRAATMFHVSQVARELRSKLQADGAELISTDH